MSDIATGFITRSRYFWDSRNRVNAHLTDVVSESGPAFEHCILGSAPEAQDIVQDVWLRWRSTDRSAVLDPRQPEVKLFRCQVDGKRALLTFSDHCDTSPQLFTKII